MAHELQRIAAMAVVVMLLFGAILAVRWARRGSGGTEFVASAMMLMLGMFGPAVQPPEQGIEEARNDKGKKGAESGDPPTV